MAKGRGGKTPSSPAERKMKNVETIDLAVKFGRFSHGIETSRLPIKIEGEQIDPERARLMFRGAQLEIEVGSDPNSSGDVVGQEKFWKDTHIVKATGECHHWSDGPKAISTGVTFNTSTVDPADFFPLSERSGRIRATRIGDAEPPKRGRPAASDEPDPEQQKFAGA